MPNDITRSRKRNFVNIIGYDNIQVEGSISPAAVNKCLSSGDHDAVSFLVLVYTTHESGTAKDNSVDFDIRTPPGRGTHRMNLSKTYTRDRSAVLK